MSYVFSFPSYRFVKRFLDIFFSFVFIAILSPVFVIIYILVLVFTGSPVIFRQKRLGISNSTFLLFKFRSMRLNHNNSLYSFPGDPRITRLGKILRLTSLDELPQLFNILVGDMSFVGPRPSLPDEIEFELPHLTNDCLLSLRRSVRPGLTSLAVIHGRSSINWEQKLHYDRIYLNSLNKSPFLTDFRILLFTMIALFKVSNTYDTYEN